MISTARPMHCLAHRPRRWSLWYRISRVGNDLQGIIAANTLQTDIRSFRISTVPAPTADADVTAKVVGDTGETVASPRFQATAPVAAMEAGDAAAALDKAFGETVAELVVWALAAI